VADGQEREETAGHAGHLDAARELVDDRQRIVLG
jgi:hypothetical protein